MKRIYMLLLLMFVLTGCEKIINDSYSFYAMNTTINVEIYEKNKNATSEVEDLFNLYAQLTSNFKRNEVNFNSPYYNLENIYTINENAGIEPVEVCEELIELLEISLSLQQTTNGYFNIGIGKIVDVWKELIENNIFVTKETYLNKLNEVEALAPVDLNKIIINKENNTVYLEDDSIKLDLGAIAKGYATQKAYELLQKKGLKKFKIVSGSSSISVGLHKEKRKFNIGLKDDNKIYEDELLGIIKIENQHLSTSGSEQQFVYVKDGNETISKIHHIVSPFSLKPENYYYKVSIVGDDAALLDAYSTAVYLMEKEEAVLFLENADLKYILYLNDKTILTNMAVSMFEQYKLKKD